MVSTADASGHLPLSGMVGILGAESLLADARALLEADADVVIDGTEVEHLDCAGAQILLALLRSLETRNRRLTLRFTPSVRAYLERAGLDDLLSCMESPKS